LKSTNNNVEVITRLKLTLDIKGGWPFNMLSLNVAFVLMFLLELKY